MTPAPPDPLDDIRDGFFVEAEELLETLRDALNGALQSPANEARERINTMFRSVHSIKGGAGAFAYHHLSDYAHRLENILEELRAGRSVLGADSQALLMQACDILEDHLRAAKDDTPPPGEGDSILAALMFHVGDLTQTDHNAAAFQPLAMTLSDLAPVGADWAVRITPQGTLYQNGNDSLFLIRALRDLSPIRIELETTGLLNGLDDFNPAHPGLTWSLTLPAQTLQTDIQAVFDFVADDVVYDVHAIIPPVDHGGEDQAPCAPPADMPPPAAAPSPVPARSDTVRVATERIDRLMNLVGEIVIQQSVLIQNAVEAGLQPNSVVLTSLEAFTMLTRDLQDNVMKIRAQPVKSLFQRMSRLLREAAQTTGKDVRLICYGEATEVDKTVIERLTEPLTHMVRNAVDHGIEPPEQRQRTGKPTYGTVTLTARHSAGRLLIDLQDDGSGINHTRVLDRARSLGLIAPDSQLTESEVENLLFLPGFSTSPTVSPLSGRGVGMDVVRSAIQALGGRIALQSRPGQGTLFSISLPLTLAVLDGMIVQVAGETMVVPISSIVETAAIGPQDIRQIGGDRNVLQLREDFVPITDLGAELGFRHHQPLMKDAIILLTRQDDGSRSALIVDAILDQRQVVIKGLQHGYGHIRGISGVTILGNGRVALIVDPADLMATPAVKRPLAMAG